jgi:ketosteroid isomerase-like protein
MGVAENIATVKRFYAAGPSDDDSGREQFFAQDAVWHVPGDNPVSGSYRGIEAITSDMSARMQPLDEWSIEPRHVMGNANLVIAIVHLKASRRGISVNTHGGHVFRFNDQGRIVEAWGFTEDQARLDELLSA